MKKFNPSLSPSLLQWQILLFIFTITIINYFDRSAISYAILPLEEEFGLNHQQFGFVASAFGIGYFIMCFFAGLLVDRFGPIKMWGAASIIWSLITLLMSFSTGFYSLFFLRFFLGLAEAVHFPALLRTITDWLSHRWRARCISLGLLGVPVASVIGAPFLSFLIEKFNWKVMFLVLGFLGILWGILWLCFFWRISKKGHKYSSSITEFDNVLDIKQPSTKTPWREMFSSRLFWGNCLNFFIFGYVVFFALVWLPGYIEQTFHVSILRTGELLIFPWAVSALFVILGGWISDIIWKKTQSMRFARVYPIGIGMLLAGISFSLIAFSKSLGTDLLLFSLGYGFAFFTNAPIFSLNADLFKEHAGTAQGIMNSFFAFAGIISPALTGWLVHIMGHFRVAILFVLLLCFLAFFISMFLQRSTKKS